MTEEIKKKRPYPKRAKKKWPSKWTITINKFEADLEIWTIVNYTQLGKAEITNEENIKEWVLPNMPMTVIQACREFWVHPTTFYYHKNKFPELVKKHDELRLSRVEYIKSMAEETVEKALKWELAWITDKDKLDASFRMLEKTDKIYNPKIEIEQKSISINLNKSSADIMEDLKKILWLNKSPQNTESTE